MGSLLPWASLSTIFGTISIAGTQGDGVITLILGAVIGVSAIVALSGQQSDSAVRRGLAFVPAVVTAGIGIYDAAQIQRVVSGVSESFAVASVGIGLWLVIAGAVLAAVSAFIRDTPTTPPTP